MTVAAQRPNQAHWSAVIESVVHAILITDEQGVVQFANVSAGVVFDYPPGELLGRPIVELIPDDAGLDGREAEAGLPRNLILAFAGLTLDTKARQRDGTAFPIEVTVTRVDVAADTTYALILRDITTRLEAAEQTRQLQLQLAKAHKLESVGQLAAGVAHEVNTPTQYVGDNLAFLRDALDEVVQVMEGFRKAALANGTSRTEELARAVQLADELDVEFLLEEIPRSIGQALEGTAQISQIVQAMRAFCHPGTHQKAAVDLNAAILNTAQVTRNEWKYVAELEHDLAADLPLVLCNENEIKQVLLNIVVNAAHAIGEVRERGMGDPGKLTIRSRKDGNWAVVEISDDGPGIPDSVMPRLFDPFFTTKDVGKGTGQGLAIAHAIVANNHDGELLVRSELGVGATFVIRLPL